MKCHKCNNMVKLDDDYCSFCGEKLIREEKRESIYQFAPGEKVDRKTVVTTSSIYKFSENEKIVNDSVLKQAETNQTDLDNTTEDNLDDNAVTGKKTIYDYLNKDKTTSSVITYGSYNKDKNNYIFVTSVVFLGLSFLISSLFPPLFVLFGIGLVVNSILIYNKNKTRKYGWAIAFSSLALILSGFSLFTALIEKDYANSASDRISEITEVSLDLNNPNSYFVSFVDDEQFRAVYTDYLFNEYIYELSEEEIIRFNSLTQSSSKFREELVSELESKIGDIMIEGVDISLVYEIKNQNYVLPSTFKDNEIIIVNYDADEGVVQILEIKG